jgi:hypothetical protein
MMMHEDLDTLEMEIFEWRKDVDWIVKRLRECPDLEDMYLRYEQELESIDCVLEKIDKISNNSYSALDLIETYIQSDYYNGNVGQLRNFIRELRNDMDFVIERGQYQGWLKS